MPDGRLLAKSRPATNPSAGRDTTVCQPNFKLIYRDCAASAVQNNRASPALL